MLELGNYPVGCLLCASIPPDTRPEVKAPGWRRPSYPTWKKIQRAMYGDNVKERHLIYDYTKRQRRCYRRYAGKGKMNLNTKKRACNVTACNSKRKAELV